MIPAPTGHPDLLSEPDRLRGPFVTSLFIHAALAAGLLVTGWIKGNPIELGAPDPAAGAVSVTPVSRAIPLPPKDGQINHLANDTESVVPQKPLPLEKQHPQREPEPEKAIELPDKVEPKRPQREPNPTPYRPRTDYARNQVFTRTPEALKSQQIGQQGGGGVGLGPNSPFGTRFAGYAQQIRDIISSHWNTADVSASPTARAVITLQILRDGSVRAVEIAAPSGSYTLDTSAKRAILESNPLPPLPPGFDRNTADVELSFQIRR